MKLVSLAVGALGERERRRGISGSRILVWLSLITLLIRSRLISAIKKLLPPRHNVDVKKQQVEIGSDENVAIRSKHRKKMTRENKINIQLQIAQRK